MSRKLMSRMGAAALALVCVGCSVYSLDDKWIQEKWGARTYAERVCAQQGLDPSSAEYTACVNDKARRRLALMFCPTNAGMYFKEDICEEAE